MGIRRGLMVAMVVSACGSAPAPTPHQVVTPAPTVVTPTAVVVTAPPVPPLVTPAPPVAPDRVDVTTTGTCSLKLASCRCEQGDADSCVDHASELAGDATTVTVAYQLCTTGEAAGCLMAATFLEQHGIAERWSTTAAALRAKAETDGQAACASNGGACFRFGEAIAAGVHAPGGNRRPDRARGRKLVAQACELGYGNACAALVEEYPEGTSRKRKQQLAQQACVAKSARGCVLVANALDAKAVARAAELWMGSCTQFDVEGCAKAGASARKLAALDPALAAFRRGCDLGDRPQCVDAAAIIDGGKATERDAVQARALFEVACNESIGAGCSGLASMVLGARGGLRDWGSSIELYQRACEYGDRAACKQARTVAAHSPDWHCATEEDCRRQCAERIVKSCTEQGRLVGQQGRDPECHASLALYRRGCDDGDGAACVLVGNAQRDQWGPNEHYADACKAGSREGCLLRDYSAASDVVFAGGGSTPKQAARALATLGSACQSNRAACFWYATAITRGPPKMLSFSEALAATCQRSPKFGCPLTVADFVAPDPHCEFTLPTWMREYWANP